MKTLYLHERLKFWKIPPHGKVAPGICKFWPLGGGVRELKIIFL